MIVVFTTNIRVRNNELLTRLVDINGNGFKTNNLRSRELEWIRERQMSSSL